MAEITQFIEVIDEINCLTEKIKPLENDLNIKTEALKTLNNELKVSLSLHRFLSEKILETYTEKELEEVGKYRKLLHPNQYIPTATAYINSSVFDPFNDEWSIYGYEKNEDKIRFLVSCKKNEGSISGLMTILDTHYTNWFKISDFNETINTLL